MNLNSKLNEGIYRDIKKIQYSSTSFSAFYHFDNINDRYYPTRGLRASMEFKLTPKVDGRVEIDTLVYEGEILGETGLLKTTNIISMDLKIEPIFPVTSKFSVLTKVRLRMSNLIGGFIPGLVNSN